MGGDRPRDVLPIELLNSFDLLANARVEYVDAIVDYNRAQFAMYVALGQPPANSLAHPVPVEGVVPRNLPPQSGAGTARRRHRIVRRLPCRPATTGSPPAPGSAHARRLGIPRQRPNRRSAPSRFLLRETSQTSSVPRRVELEAASCGEKGGVHGLFSLSDDLEQPIAWRSRRDRLRSSSCRAGSGRRLRHVNRRRDRSRRTYPRGRAAVREQTSRLEPTHRDDSKRA